MLHKVPIFRIFPYNNLFLQNCLWTPQSALYDVTEAKIPLPGQWKEPHPVAGSAQRHRARTLHKDGQSIQFNKGSNAEVPKTCMPLSASSQTRLQMAPPTQPNMKSSCFKMSQKSQDATGHETMNLWASKGLFTNQRVTSLRLRPALYTVIFFWLVHLMYTEANSRFCCWRLKTKGLKGGNNMSSFSATLSIHYYIPAGLAMHDRSEDSRGDGSICRSDYSTAAVWLQECLDMRATVFQYTSSNVRVKSRHQ